MEKIMDNFGKAYGQLLPGVRMGCAPRLYKYKRGGAALPLAIREIESFVYF